MTTAPERSENPPRVLYFGREGCERSAAAEQFLQQLGFDVESVISGGMGGKLPDWTQTWDGDYILCFRSYYILSADLISRARIAAINFHPGPVEYPGSGCANFALYEGAQEFGVTAHLMEATIDSGSVLLCERFPIFDRDDAMSLLPRSHAKLLDVFYSVVGRLYARGAEGLEEMLRESAHETWAGSARKLRELLDIQQVDADISAAELDRVIRATHSTAYPTRLKLHGRTFELRKDSA